jgi:hypothetical protein
LNLDRQTTEKGCIEYVDPDLRSMGVPVKVPPGFMMYRVCGNGCCLNPQHMYYVDGDTSHQMEIDIREVTLKWLRDYFKVNHKTLEPLEKKPPPTPDNGEAKIWLPRR